MVWMAMYSSVYMLYVVYIIKGLWSFPGCFSSGKRTIDRKNRRSLFSLLPVSSQHTFLLDTYDRETRELLSFSFYRSLLFWLLLRFHFSYFYNTYIKVCMVPLFARGHLLSHFWLLSLYLIFAEK